jgi:hypothetical protein
MFCDDCGIDTLTETFQEYYMVKDNVWLRAKSDKEGFLCIGCLENRLGRRLSYQDFSECNLNTCIAYGLYNASDRLFNRITTLS